MSSIEMLGAYMARATVDSREDWVCSISFFDVQRNHIALTGIDFALAVTPAGGEGPIWSASTDDASITVSGDNVISWSVMAPAKAAWTGVYSLSLMATDGTNTKTLFADGSTLTVGAPNALSLVRLPQSNVAQAYGAFMTPSAMATALASLSRPERLALFNALLGGVANTQAGEAIPNSGVPFINSSGFVVIAQ